MTSFPRTPSLGLLIVEVVSLRHGARHGPTGAHSGPADPALLLCLPLDHGRARDQVRQHDRFDLVVKVSTLVA